MFSKTDRETRFAARQKRTRRWVNFREIADWLADLDAARRSISHEAGRSAAFGMLQDDFLAGDFEEASRSMVLYLHPSTRMVRLQQQQLSEILATVFTRHQSASEVVQTHYLAHCWIPRRLFDRWLAKHELPRAPQRFEPQEADHPKKEKRSRKTDRDIAEADRALYPEIEQLMRRGLSLHAAVSILATADKIAGSGTRESKITRLEKRYADQPKRIIKAKV
jgi:hypothetical protein